jgi:serine/threonine protein kinase
MALPTDTKLVETLGEGTFGTVYVAQLKEGAIQRTVVLKVLKPNWVSNQDILNRSKDEAALLARLNHDNIVKVEQLTSIQGRPAVVMEYVRGLTLDVVLKRHGAIPVGVALQIVARVASALDAAFNKVPPGMERPLRVVHRDIKPSNIILSVNGAVKVLDFGTARGEFSDREAETHAVTLGSPRYMAPERFDGVNSGPGIDVYALGVTFYELLGGRSMGRMPLNPERHKAKTEKAMEALRPKKGGGKDLDALLSLLKHCLAYAPEDRLTASDFRKRALKILSKLSGATVTLDVFAETVVEPIWEKRKKVPVMPLGDGHQDIFTNQGSSESIATGTNSGLSGQSTASSLVFAAGGSRKVLTLLVGGLVVAFGGLVLLKTTMDDPKTAHEDLQVVENALPGPLTATAMGAKLIEEAEEASAQRDTPQAEQSAAPNEEPDAPETENAEAVEKERIPDAIRPVAPSPPRGPSVSFRLVSLPSGATLSVGGQQFLLPTSSELPQGQYKSTIRFPSGSEFDCTLKLADGATLLFREKNEGCP